MMYLFFVFEGVKEVLFIGGLFSFIDELASALNAY